MIKAFVEIFCNHPIRFTASCLAVLPALPLLGSAIKVDECTVDPIAGHAPRVQVANGSAKCCHHRQGQKSQSSGALTDLQGSLIRLHHDVAWQANYQFDQLPLLATTSVCDAPAHDP